MKGADLMDHLGDQVLNLVWMDLLSSNFTHI